MIFFPEGIVVGILAIVLSKNKKSKGLTWSLFTVSLAAALMAAASAIGLSVSVVRAIIHGGRSLLTHCRFPDAIGYSSITNECPFDPTRIYSTTLILWVPLIVTCVIQMVFSARCLLSAFHFWVCLAAQTEKNQTLRQSGYAESSRSNNKPLTRYTEPPRSYNKPQHAILKLQEAPMNLQHAIQNLQESTTNLKDGIPNLQGSSSADLLPLHRNRLSIGVFLPRRDSLSASQIEKGQTEKGKKQGLAASKGHRSNTNCWRGEHWRGPAFGFSRI
ncbi:Transmembrane protein 54 Beta-casein-like protein CAC-1 [Larimichthys crocea]|uniref:Transmembrane protein 54 Beta-casein-like protein CAC-1 n=1 Tax=Larimichthys crocea TaxID=215358 RepID=A0A6G0HEM5_LARCR|nr:Transmembrane protein 54 Beta-casein-like protein CAC-1 [Larimichthys crocea]